MATSKSKGQAAAESSAATVANESVELSRAELLRKLLAEVTPEEMEEVGQVIKQRAAVVNEAVKKAAAKDKAAADAAARKQLEQQHKLETQDWIKQFAGRVGAQAPSTESAKDFKKWVGEQLKDLPKLAGTGTSGRKRTSTSTSSNAATIPVTMGEKEGTKTHFTLQTIKSAANGIGFADLHTAYVAKYGEAKDLKSQLYAFQRIGKVIVRENKYYAKLAG